MFQNLLKDLLEKLQPRKWYIDLILSEEKLYKEEVEKLVSAVSEKIDQSISKGVEKVEQLMVTRKYEVKDVIVFGRRRLFSITSNEGKVRAGFIKEILIVSDTSDFKLQIRADNRDLINDSFSSLMARSAVTSEFDALQDESGNYVFVIGNIGFANDVSIWIEGDRVRLKYLGVNYNIIR